jgi:Mycothiol maleylpyruvate isomerase N-terminal domain
VTFGDQASPAEILTQACESTRSILGNVTREQLALPTPCEDWPVQDLIDHIAAATRFFADIAGGGTSRGRRGAAKLHQH